MHFPEADQFDSPNGIFNMLQKCNSSDNFNETSKGTYALNLSSHHNSVSMI